jgi:hypothetical protein
VAGSLYGAGIGWGTIVIGLFVVGGISSLEQAYRRRRYKNFFVRREFDRPKPIYQQQQWSPPPRQEAPPKSEPKPEAPRRQQPRKVESLRDAFGILGIPKGRVSIEQVRLTYKTRMLEYRPDRVAHLGPELRQLADLKAKEFNAAMDYIASHLPKV